jgi:hypothetical protein
MISHHAALIYTMTLVSAADSEMSDAEMRTMGEIVGFLPVFRDYDGTQLPQTAGSCAELLDQEDGLERVLELIKAGLPPKLRETAYAVACDVAVSNRTLSQEVLRMLELLRHKLEVERLAAAAIERGARARFATL